MKKDNSVVNDLMFVVGSVVMFYIVLIFANWFDGKFGLAQAYTLVDIAALALKVTTASALAWIVKRTVFAHTLGKDFGKTFDAGWNQMDTVEKSRWIIGTFLVIFAAIMYASSGTPIK